MGVDIHVKVLYFNSNTESFEEIILYKQDRTKYEEISAFDARYYDLFEILQESDFPKRGLSTSKLFPEKINKEISEWASYGYGFYQTTLADIELFIKNTEDTEYVKPVKYFYDKIKAYIDFYNTYANLWYIDSDIKILYWFDR